MIKSFKAKIVFDPIDKTKKHKDQSSWKNVAICKTYDDIDLYYSWFIFKRFNLIVLLEVHMLQSLMIKSLIKKNMTRLKNYITVKK